MMRAEVGVLMCIATPDTTFSRFDFSGPLEYDGFKRERGGGQILERVQFLLTVIQINTQVTVSHTSSVGVLGGSHHCDGHTLAWTCLVKVSFLYLYEVVQPHLLRLLLMGLHHHHEDLYFYSYYHISLLCAVRIY